MIAISLFFALAAQAFTVTQFSPQGTVKAPRQVRAVFSEAMVPLGDPRQPDPFARQCPGLGKGLWEDSRTWIFEFASELPSGQSCAFTARRELKSLQGGAWENPTAYAFDTGGPAVARAYPYEQSALEQRPAFLLHLDGAVDPGSLEGRVYLLVEGMPERIPLRLLPPSVVARMVKARNGGYGEEEQATEKKAAFVGFECRRTLPAGARLQLVWGKGIRSPGGATTAADQLLAYRTIGPFTADFSCQRENKSAPCLPIGAITVSFSTGMPRKLAEQVRITSSGASWKPVELPKGAEHAFSVQFQGPFPPHREFRLVLPPGIQDEYGRPLKNARHFPLEFRTGGYPPLAKFAAPFGVVEAADPVLPVTLRNLEPAVAAAEVRGAEISVSAENPRELLGWVEKLQDRHDSYIRYEGERRIDLRDEPLLGGIAARRKFSVPKPQGAEAFEVLGIPLKEKGFHVVELESRILGKALLDQPRPLFVATGALVTNLGVHFKWGSENSLAWVTALDSGRPVPGARVRVADCTGKVLWEGRTGSDGAVIAETIPAEGKAARCEGRESYRFAGGLAVIADKAGDFSFVHTSWDNGIEAWRFHLPTGGEGGETMAHTVFDRTLFRAGQTVHMKHVLREQFLRGIRFARGEAPAKLVLRHSNGKIVVLPVSFRRNGTAESDWKIPEGAELGGYSVYLTNQSPDSGGKFRSWGEGVWLTGSFRVEEFRLPVMAGSLQWAQQPLVAQTELPLDISVRYLSGGGAGNLGVRLRSRAEPEGEAYFPRFEGFTFANGGLATGKSTRGGGGARADKGKNFPDQALTLDAAGSARTKLRGIPALDQPVRVSAEAEYRDPNGEAQTVSRSVVVYPAPALVGIAPDGWIARADAVKFRVAVADPEGRPLPGRQVRVEWRKRETFSHRKRIVGGFYAYENFEEVKALGPACSGETGRDGVLPCEAKAPGSGDFVLVAETGDGKQLSRAHHDIWVAGAEEQWLASENDDRIDLLPEKKAYEPGETARFQLRSPFRKATALVTVEREGVLERFVKEVDGKDPVIELPVSSAYAPNVFVSAFLVRGRVGEPQATALVDLAKPAHKLGMARIDVGWKAHRLNVAVEADRAEYKVREKARVRVRVTRAADGKAAAKGEVLLAAVDEALLELMPNRSWKLLDGMMGERPLRVRTSTAQSYVVGKRHFGLKALPAGGGGGRNPSRELFDTLLYWKASLPLNGDGEAVAEVPMNDSLSSFRIVAVATEEADRFGTGEQSVRTRQDLMLFPDVAPLARNGDRFHPGVTVRNTSGHPLQVKVAGRAGGQLLPEKTLSVAPGASTAVSWELTAPKNGNSLAYEFSAAAGETRDSVKVSQKLEPPLRASVLQATLERLEGRQAFPLQLPKGSLPGSGGLKVKLARSLAGGLEGVRRRMEEYPYSCLEQEVSRAVALRDPQRWQALMARLSPYIDRNGLLKFFPQAEWGSDTLTSYVLAVAQEAGWQLPDYALPQLVGGLKSFVEGKSYSAGFLYPAADLAIRKLAAMDALSRYQSFDPAELGAIQIQPELWPLRALIDWTNLLRREAAIPQRAGRLKQAEQIIRARLEWRGTTVAFKGESPLWWLLSSEDEEANRLLLAAAGDSAWSADLGRLVRGVLARQHEGAWDLTTANAWGALAIERFSAVHEKEPIGGSALAELGGRKETVDWNAGVKEQELHFGWPEGKSSLALSQFGKGKPWAFVEASAAVKLGAPIFKGYRLQRTVTPVSRKVPGKWSAGDVYRVRLAIEAPADMTWVAVSDPIPAGATVLGSGLGGDSALLTRGERQKGWSWGTYEERSFSGFRTYHEWMPKGAHQVEYTVRLNGAGTFQLPNSRVEALYAPEMFAEVPNENLVVQP